ncbi:MAG: tRNA pseudouridine(55) synthase TruB [Rhodocyclaceae bacterium]|nr:MAG: tRNA pseudouridine(55) synthase TruB [Rhodocyclaceae bacterium]
MNKPRRAPRRPVDGVLLLDKPQGFTSNAALQKARWLLNAAKAGHTGTLDPLATGLLPLCFGEATKFSSELLDADKAYRATLQLGVTTDTADAEGTVLQTRPVAVTESRLKAVLEDFLGEQDQVPPMYSALKKDGKPLYEYARQGLEVERKARRVSISRINLVSLVGDQAVIDVDCSKGTYIRTLAADIGEALGCGAHIAALRRTRIGRLTLEGAVTLEAFETAPVETRDAMLAPPDTLVSELPRADLSPAETARVLHGQGLRWNAGAGERWRMYSPDQRFLGLGEMSPDGWLNPRRLVVTQEKAE